ncbi:hypothetical protein, partial [Kallipyga massiliensis]|uniref:hypothetical protein n=1 Tax=Kallipyga massiliensis TaxID=1472764 RepID=UPI001C54F469
VLPPDILRIWLFVRAIFTPNFVVILQIVRASDPDYLVKWRIVRFFGSAGARRAWVHEVLRER